MGLPFHPMKKPAGLTYLKRYALVTYKVQVIQTLTPTVSTLNAQAIVFFLCGVGKHWVYRLNISQTLTPEEGIAYACPSMGTDSFPRAERVAVGGARKYNHRGSLSCRNI